MSISVTFCENKQAELASLDNQPSGPDSVRQAPPPTTPTYANAMCSYPQVPNARQDMTAANRLPPEGHVQTFSARVGVYVQLPFILRKYET